MRTFIAFRIDTDNPDEFLTKGIERIRKHYYESIDKNVNYTEKIIRYKNIGAVIFDLEDSPLLWKDVYEENNFALITYAPPTNWKRYCNSKDIKKAPGELLNYLVNNPHKSHGFSAPTCFATLDKSQEELNIYTDAMGFSRLYEYRGENGWFWSNRAGALPLLAGEKAEINKDGWSNLCAAGWFIGNNSPIENVIRIDQGIRVNISSDINQPRKLLDDGSFSNLVSSRPKESIDYENIAEDMKFNLDSFRNLWNLPLIVDLSGGKDSRICSAAVISSGATDVEFRTVANYDEEVNVAHRLLKKIGLENKHLIVNPIAGNDSGKVIKRSIEDRMKLFFHSTDGDCTPAVVQNNITEKSLYTYSTKLKIAGPIGAAAKPLYYNTEKRVEKLERLGNDAALERLKQSYFKYDSVRPEIQNKTIESISAVLQKGRSYGLRKLELLDYFFIADRGRRWTPQNNHIDRYSVFFSNVFLSEAMNLTIDERLNNEFFKGINEYLVPEWHGEAYFKQSTEFDERSHKKMRLWQTSDKEGIEEILNNPDIWNEYFDEEKLIKLWEDAKNDVLGAYTDASEKLFYRVMMIAHYQDYLKRVNHHISK
ncbi:hypothetical protein [Salinicoccus sp. YB14-2]|uniref:hypothetical protein n=1 Tax=Salinicoccus sp. YB14-2 TaxID=1572701 RepID=UPI00068A24DF|nr:hypothetical protein [Salinicoccus sp. YB14-2]